MAKPILVANWKNNPPSLSEASSLITLFARQGATFKKFFFFIAPPQPFLDLVAKKAKGFARLATQDIFVQPVGTYTGEITIDILKSFGVKLAILGHSERRSLGETSIEVAKKVRIAIKGGVTPLICIGEEVRDAEGNFFEVVRNQIISILQGLKKSEVEKIMIAYEPVWAVGSKAKGVMEEDDLAQMVIFIKKVLTEMFSRSVAEKVPILYGGSVDEDNAGLLIEKTGVRGLLVGRASLHKGFIELAKSLLK